MDSNENYEILSGISSPGDIRKLDDAALDKLCGEIRDKMIRTVSDNGGHLASNLGTVELTLAIHKSFSSPEDKIVWDVGHQAYTHKLITGRYDRFATLRKEDGISGFVRPDESVHDSFYEGHAGTSISQAAGLAEANFIKGSRNYVIAVIGDGSFGNGMVYEGLNCAGQKGRKLIVVLNDNEMSISESVGAMGRRLAAVRSKPEYYRFKAKTEKLLDHIPLIGRPLANFLFKVKSLIKSYIYKSSFFEDVGFRYIGPVDGHNINTLCEAFDAAKLVDCPVLLHVNTIKGKGYDFAEQKPELYHGVSEFNIYTGKSEGKNTDYSSEFGKILCDFASKDKRICAVTAAMSIGTGLDEFFRKFPERAFDVGIAEEHAVTFCSGLTAGGMIPVFAVYSTFFQRCIDQIIHDGALQRRKMIVTVDRAGFVGEDGETHQGLYDVSLVSGLPNVTVYSPATYEELSESMYNALYRDSNLVIIRYPRGKEDESITVDTHDREYNLIGDAGAEISLVTYGREFFEVYRAYEKLIENGLSVNVIKLNKIKPIPADAVNEVLASNYVFFYEEGVTGGGTGEQFCSELVKNSYKGKYYHTGINNEFAPHASVQSLLRRYSLDTGSIIAAVTERTENER